MWDAVWEFARAYPLTIALVAAALIMAAKVGYSWLRRQDIGGSGDWQVRCPKCGQTRDAREAGVVRVFAASRGKRILARCSQCGRLRWAVVERKPAAEAVGAS